MDVDEREYESYYCMFGDRDELDTIQVLTSGSMQMGVHDVEFQYKASQPFVRHAGIVKILPSVGAADVASLTVDGREIFNTPLDCDICYKISQIVLDVFDSDKLSKMMAEIVRESMETAASSYIAGLAA